MTTEKLLTSLDKVRATGQKKWSACCPAHADQNPSLSIREGERGILLHCWAGCSVNNICQALGISVGQLFYDAKSSIDPTPNRSRPSNWRALSHSLLFHAEDLFLRAENVLQAAKGLHIREWTPQDLDYALKALAQAYQDLERADCLENVACSLRTIGLAKERIHAPRS